MEHRKTVGRRTHCLVLAFSVVCLSWRTAATATEVILRPQATPRTRIVRLGDIADIQGIAGAEARRLSQLPLMPAPAPGANHELSSSDVRDWLAVLGEDLTDFSFAGAPRVVVGFGIQSSPRRAEMVDAPDSSALPDEDVLTVLTERHLASSISRQQREELENQVKEAILLHIRQATQDDRPWDAELTLPPGSFEQLEASSSPLTVTGGEAPWEGPQRFVVRFSKDSADVLMPVDATILKPVPVLMAAQAVARDQVITRADLELKYFPADDRQIGRRPTTEKLADVVGQTATRPIRQGDIIYLDTLQAPLMVRRGETVMATARGGGIEVRTYAKSRHDGIPGDIIEVESLDTKKSFFAKVVGQRRVVVHSTGSYLPTASQTTP